MARVPEQMSQHTVDNYKCSRCWGFLVKEWAVDAQGVLEKTDQGEQLVDVKCRSCDADLGFVSNTFIERERVSDFENAFEVKRDLIQMGIITKEKAYGNTRDCS